MGDAAVTASREGPCLGVADDEIERLGELSVASIGVWDVERQGELWSTTSKDPPGRALVFDKGACVPYGTAPLGFSQAPSPAPRLEPGHVYELTVSASPTTQKRDGTQGYTQRFCLSGRDGTTLVLLAPNVATCGPPPR